MAWPLNPWSNFNQIQSPNDWNRLRLQQMFGQGQDQGIGFDPSIGAPNQSSFDQSSFEASNPMEYESAPPPEIPDLDIQSMYNQRYKPQMTMQNMFADAARNPPSRDDYKPSGMRRIGAALAGLSGSGPAAYWGGVPVGFKGNPNAYENVTQVLDEPYNKAALDYKLRIDPLRAAADDERMANVNQRQIADQSINREIQNENLRRMYGKDIRTGDQADVRLQQAGERNKVLERQVAVQEWRTKNPTMKLIFDEAGFVREWDPTGNKLAAYVTDQEGEPVRASQLPERERIRIQVEGRDQNIETAGAQARKTKETPAAPLPPRTTTSTEVVKDAQGNIVGSRSREATSGTTPQGRAAGGNKVVMYAPNGQAAWIPVDKTDQAQEDGFTFNDPRTGSDFRPPVQRRTPIIGGR